MAGVVDLAVVVLDGPDQGVLAQGGELPQGLLLRQVPVAGDAVPSAHGVVEQHAAADVRALPDPVLQRVEERHRPREVRRETVDEQVPLGEGLADQVEVEHLEVAQAAVDELAGPARRAARPVLRLDHGRRQPTADGVEGDAGTRHATADDEDVELAAAVGARPQRVERVLSSLCRQRCCAHVQSPG